MACSARTRRGGAASASTTSSFLSAIANMIAGAIQRRQSDQRHELMIRELRHRSGNLFAQLLALFSQTARNSRSVPELIDQIRGARAGARQRASPDHRRRLALDLARRSAARAARALSRTRHARRARMFFSSRIRHSRSPPRCTSLPPMPANTAACRRRPDGSTLSWTVNRTEHGLALELDWKERGGPPPKRARKQRLRLAPDRHGDRAPAQRASGAHVRSGRAGRAADRAAHARALAAAGGAGR